MIEESANISFINNEPNLSPQSVVDCASLTNSMDKNKESLKVKLMLRRPINVLVDQGILPPPTSSPAFHEQKLKLERAKTGDFLKHKIQRRPLKDELIQQHILEESFDPSYYEEERKLKKARLADDLNERLSQRPGPLELIKGNILHTDQCLEQAIKEGQITFKKTCEGEIIKNPPKRFVFEEESSSDSAPSPHPILNNSCTLTLSNQQNVVNYPFNNSFIVSNNGNLVSIPQTEPPKSIPSSTPNQNLSYIVTTSNKILPSTSTTLFITKNNALLNENSNHLNTPMILPNNSNIISSTITSKCELNRTGSPNQVITLPISTQINLSQKSKKKIKSKNQSKTRIIKFHEYTGPPNVKKQTNSSQQHVETSYELLLKQQQMFLQWQLESQHGLSTSLNQNISDEESIKTVSMISEESMKNENEKMILQIENSKNSLNSGNFQIKNQTDIKSDESIDNTSGTIISSSESTSTRQYLNSNNQSLKQYTPIVKIISKLEDMKVSDLKAELKKRNLPVSGAKQQLIERLKPFSDSVVSTNNSIVTTELNGATTILNIGECKNGNTLTNQDIINNNINNNFTTLTGPTTFILKHSNEVKKNLNDEVLFIANNNDNFSTIPLQLKQSNPITLDAPTLTIPFTNTFIPQYQIVSSTPTDNKINIGSINLTTPNTIQAPMTNSILMNNKLNIINPQPNIISTSLNYNQMNNSIGKNSNLAILTGEPLQLGPMKNGLSFNISQPVPNITNKLVSIQNPGPIIHQLFLYPTTVNSPQDISTLNGQQNISVSAKQRSNSLPSESLHQLQRNTSLPMVSNQSNLPKTITEQSSKNNIEDITIGKIDKRTSKQSNNNDKSAAVNLIQKSELSSSTISVEKTVLFENAKFSEGKSEFLPLKPFFKDKTTSITPISTNLSSNLVEENITAVDNSVNQIQPDSTTSSSSFDLDFILNFDDLNDLQVLKQNDKIDQQMNFDNKKNYSDNKNNSMIDFNWFDMDFDQAAMTKEVVEESSKFMQNETIPNDCSFLDSINQIFDQSFSSSSTKGCETLQIDQSKQDSSLCHNYLASTSNGFSQNNHSNQQCHFSANYTSNNLKYNNMNGSNNTFDIDSLNEFFDENDFKNSIEFPILLDS